MLRTLLLLTFLAFAGGTATAHADRIIAVDIIAKHDVAWDLREGRVDDDCSTWSKGSGTESLQIHSKRREQLRLEHAFGRTLLSGKRAGTFEGQLSRNGTWKVHVPPNQPPCSPCGPNSEYGLCTDPVPQKPLAFSCGTRDAKRPMAMVGYVASGIPSLAAGLQVMALTQSENPFPNCPPSLPKGMRGPTLQTPRPTWERLPQSDVARIARLKVGDSVTAEVKRQRTYLQQDGKVVRGDNCARMPDLKEGYSECAVTEYAVTFTRLS